MDFQTFWERLAPFHDTTLVLGCSGGLDSMCLFELLLRAQTKINFPLVIAHIEHGLRGEESLTAAQLVEKEASIHKIPFHQLTISPGALGSSNIEGAARQARLAFFARLCSVHYPGAAIVLAHHADDAVETLFLRLERGGNCSSLANLRFDTKIGGLRILRPLLETSRRELEEFAAANAIAYVDDSTNADSAFERNFLRNELLPRFYRSGNRIRGGVQASLEALRLDADFLESSARAALGDRSGRQETDLELWQSLHPALFPRVLRLYLSSILNREWLPNAEQIARIQTFFSGAGRELAIADGFLWRKNGNRAVLSPAASGFALSEREWDWHQNACLSLGDGRILQAQRFQKLPKLSHNDKYTGWFDAELLPPILTVGPRRPGEVIVAFDNTERKVKKLLIDAKIPEYQRKNTVLLRANDTVLLLFGIRQSNFAQVTEKTREIVKITLSH